MKEVSQNLAVEKDEELRQDNPSEDTQDESTDYSQIYCLEQPPQDEWFFETTGPNGEPLVYLRFQATGLLPRRYGPFPSREVAIWILDEILSDLDDALIEAENTTQDHKVKIRFHRRPESVMVENFCTFQPELSEPEKGA